MRVPPADGPGEGASGGVSRAGASGRAPVRDSGRRPADEVRGARGAPLLPLRGLRAPTPLGRQRLREWARAAAKLHTKGAGFHDPRL